MPYDKIALALILTGLGFASGFGLKAKLDKAEILQLNTSVAVASQKAVSELEVATEKVAAKEAETEAVKQKVESEREQFKKESTDIGKHIDDLVGLHNASNKDRANALRKDQPAGVSTCVPGEREFTARVLEFDARVLEFAGRAAKAGANSNNLAQGYWEIVTKFKEHQDEVHSHSLLTGTDHR